MGFGIRVDAECFHFFVEGGAVDAEDMGGGGAVPVVGGQGGEDDLAFWIAEGVGEGHGGPLCGCVCGLDRWGVGFGVEVCGEVACGDGLAFGEDGGAFDDVGEFADIAWVGVVLEELHRLVGESDEVAIEFFGL